VSAPLTTLSDDERLFRDSLFEFADREIRPLVRQMDEQARMPRTLIDRLFALGAMGIEVPDSRGGAGATFFHAVLAVEALSRVDPSVGVLVDVQNTLAVNAVLRWGTEAQQAELLPRLATSAVGAYALSEAASGSDAFALQTRAQASDDGYALTGGRCGSPTPTKPTSSSSLRPSTLPPATRASPRSSSNAAPRASRSVTRKTSSASAPAARAS